MKTKATQVSSKLRQKIDAVGRTEQPLEAARKLLAQHVGRPYFEDLKSGLKIRLLLRRVAAEKLVEA